MDSAQTMAYFFDNIDVFLLIIVRLLGFFIILPVLSGSNIPLMVRTLLAMSMAYIIFSSTLVIHVHYYPTILGFGMLAAGEFITGFLMAYVVYIVFSVLFLVGQMIDMQIGFSMVSVLDPITQIQVPIAGNLLFMTMGVMLVQSGGLHSFISALFFSYDVMPIGHTVIINNASIINSLLLLMADYFVMGVQIAMPIVGSLLILTIALGILVKSVPQMNIFVVGIPIKLLLGLIIFFFIIPVFSQVYDELFAKATRALINMIRNLSS